MYPTDEHFIKLGFHMMNSYDVSAPICSGTATETVE